MSELSRAHRAALGLPADLERDSRGRMQGCWVAYPESGSRLPVVVFDSEVAALRHALIERMQVRFVKWGEAI